MQYKALYRKYRPDNFDQICGQDSIVKILKNSIKDSKVSHAYLFCGPRGSGKTSIAKVFAKSINCAEPNEGNACGQCEVCLQIENNQSQDIIEIDAASNNGVDEIREIRSKVNLLPTFCKYKVYIIDEVHMLSTGAFNALLKTLEEPPAHVIFILATTEVHKIPSTIMSRCQRFDFKKINEKTIVDRLKYISEQENIRITDAAIKRIALIADGGLRDAIGLLDQAASYSDDIEEIDIDDINGTVTRENSEAFIRAIYKRDKEHIMNTIGFISDSGKDILKFAEDLMIITRNVILSIDAPKYYLENVAEEYDLNTVYKQDLYNFAFFLNDLIDQIKISNYQRLIFEVGVLKYIESLEFVVVEEIKEEIIQNKEVVKPEVKEESVTIEIAAVQEIVKPSKSKIKTLKKVVDMNKIEDLCKIRINNALAEASKEEMKNIQKIWKKINEYSLDKEVGSAAGILLDANVRVVSKTHIVVSYPYETIVVKTNSLLNEVEKIISMIANSKYKVISISDEKWELIKNEYIKKTKDGIKYDLIEENIEYIVEEEVEEMSNNNSIMELLGEVVEIK